VSGLLPGAGAERRPEACPVCDLSEMGKRMDGYRECPECGAILSVENLARLRATRAAEIAAADEMSELRIERYRDALWHCSNGRKCNGCPMENRLLQGCCHAADFDHDGHIARALLSPPGDAAERRG
jgi:hypothetical protein